MYDRSWQQSMGSMQGDISRYVSLLARPGKTPPQKATFHSEPCEIASRKIPAIDSQGLMSRWGS